MIFKYTLLVASVCLLPFALLSQNSADSTQSEYGTWDKFTFQAGGFVTNTTSALRFGSQQLGVGLDINLEQALGLQTTSFTGQAHFSYRFTENRRHAVRAGYYQLSRKSSKDLEAELKIGDFIFSAGSVVETGVNISIIKFDYDYSIYLDDRVNISLSAGMFMMPTIITFQAEGESLKESKFIAPLPVLGLRTNFKITPRFTMFNIIDVFYMSSDFFTGNMVDMNLGLEYKAWDHFAFGVGYNGFTFDFTVNTGSGLFGDTFGELGYKYAGLAIYGKILF